MFFSKKKFKQECAAASEQFLARLKTAQVETLKKLDEEISAAKKITDAGEKLLKLEELDNALSEAAENIDREIDNLVETIKIPTAGKMNKRFSFGVLGGITVFIGAIPAAALAAASLPFLAPALFVGGMGAAFGSMIFSIKDDNALREMGQALGDSLKTQMQEFKDNLSNRQSALQNEINDILNGSLEPLARSKKFDVIFKDYEDLRDRFAAAAAKKVRETPPAQPHGAPKPGHDGRTFDF